MHQINWAVLGCGHIANTFMSSIKAVEQAAVVACAASDFNRAKCFAESYEIAKYFGDYQSMLNERNIHAVYIATTHNFHFEQIMMCLHSGKHVLCEKPLTLNAAQAKQAFALAAENNLLLVEAVWTRFLPAIQAIKKLIADGTIGNIQAIQANFSFNRDLPDTHRLLDPKLAGGALLDLGIYPITLADIVFAKKPVKISSEFLRAATGVDKNSFYTLAYENGAVAQLSAGFGMSGPIYANIMGDKGIIHIPFFLGAKSFELTLEGQETEHFNYNFPDANNFTFEIEHVTDCLLVDKTTSDVMPADTSIRVLEIMDYIRTQWDLSYPNEVKIQL